jgi:pimeloyl-ACP methyl ester carboxylesterase
MSQTVRSSYLFLNGIRVHYLQAGDLGGLENLVLLHGLASNARIWQLALPMLESEGRLLLAPDGRGHGLSDGPDGDYSFDIHFQDLHAFMNMCNLERPILIGHSWGASRVLDYAARTQYGPRSPSAIILIDGGIGQLNDHLPGKPPPTWEEVRARLTPPRLAGTLLSEITKRIRSTIVNWGINENQQNAVAEIILANFEIYLDATDQTECVRPHLTFEHHMQIVRALWEFNTYDRFKQVRCPVLMIPARHDGPLTVQDEHFLATKKHGLEIARKAIPDLQVAWMENTIHDIPLQRPDDMARLVNHFITSARTRP